MYSAQLLDELKDVAWPVNGFAPGGYMSTCRDCGKQLTGVAKRTSKCLACAVDGMAVKTSMVCIGFGDRVRRADNNGKPPAYRFEGTICGTYTNPATGTPGYVVSNAIEPGLIQIFPAYMLETVPNHTDEGER